MRRLSLVQGGSGSTTSVLNPRMGVGHGESLWPRCTLCRRTVSAYGVDAETDKYIEFFVRCDGIADPYGGAHARSYRAGIRIDKRQFASGWTRNTSVDILSRLSLYPGKFGKWQLKIGHPDGIVPT